MKESRGGRGVLASLSDFAAFAADEIQMDLTINSALFPLPFMAGDRFFSKIRKIPWHRKCVFPSAKKDLFICSHLPVVGSPERSSLLLSPSRPPATTRQDGVPRGERGPFSAPCASRRSRRLEPPVRSMKQKPGGGRASISSVLPLAGSQEKRESL